MKILFIFPIPPKKYVFVDFQQGIGILSALLKQAGHETSLLVIDNLDKKRISKKIKKFNPDIISLSFTTDQRNITKDIVNYIHNKYNLFVLVGGVHPTICPNDVIKFKGVDAICIGEGEGALIEFVKALENKKDYSKIKNIWVKKNGEIIKNSIRPLIQNLDSLPFADRELFDYQKLLNIDHRADFTAGRGCPYQCSYCINHQLIKLYKDKGKYIRIRSVDNVFDEISQVLNKYKNIESICFQDDTFTINKKWLKEFCEKYPKKFKLPLICNTRANLIDEETVDILKKARCTEIRMGVEHGNEYIRNNIMRRNMCNDEIINAFRIVKKAGIKAWAFNMIGLPFETEETIKETIELNKKIKPNKVFISIFYPYPSTELYDLCKKNKWLTNINVNTYFEPISTINQPTISKKKIEYYYRIFRIAVMYPKFLFIAKILAKIPLSKKIMLYDVVYINFYKLFSILRSLLPIKIKNKLFDFLKI